MSEPLSRAPQTMWSRRRAAVQAEADRQDGEAALIAQEREALEQKSDADILQELSLQDPEQMQAGDDFAAFMRAEVPERLRRRALRKLWRSNPVLACVDELVDYGEDFKAGWDAGGVVRTAYRIGKGMLAHVQEMERQKADDQPGAPVEDDAAHAVPETAQNQAGPDASDAPEPEPAPEPASEPEPAPEAEVIENTPQFQPIRRMRFEFEGAA